MYKQITIDGPAGSGKSTVALKLAQMLDYKYISSGMLYRAITYYLKERNTNLSEINEIKFQEETKNITINIDSDQKIILNNNNITDYLYQSDISKETSILSKHWFIREYVNSYLKDFSKNYNIVVDGRDMGTVVFPDAFLKFYLDASIEVRAKRRYDQIIKQTNNSVITIDDIKNEILERDNNDLKRESSPLAIPTDAFVINSDDLTIGEVVNKMYEIAKDKLDK